MTVRCWCQEVGDELRRQESRNGLPRSVSKLWGDRRVRLQGPDAVLAVPERRCRPGASTCMFPAGVAPCRVSHPACSSRRARCRANACEQVAYVLLLTGCTRFSSQGTQTVTAATARSSVGGSIMPGPVAMRARHRPLVPITQQQHGSSAACYTAVLSPNGKFLDLPFLLSYRTTWVWGWQQSRALPTTPNDDRTWLDALAPWLAW